jgi:hypothetical protein
VTDMRKLAAAAAVAGAYLRWAVAPAQVAFQLGRELGRMEGAKAAMRP